LSGQIKAYPEEYNELKAEMDKLRDSITVTLTDVNSRLLQMTSVTGPFYSNKISSKLSGLLFMLRAYLDYPHKENMVAVGKCLKGFADELSANDKASG
jgi:hypothetical protein